MNSLKEKKKWMSNL